MALIVDFRRSRWDAVMIQMARWLTRHLNDPELVLWISKHGVVSDVLGQLVEAKLDEITLLERDGKIDELECISANGPNSIPRPVMRTIWRLLLSGRIRPPSQSGEFFRWTNRLRRDGMTATLRLQVRELFAPKITISRPFRWNVDDVKPGLPTRVRDLLRWELVLASGEIRGLLNDVTGSKIWLASLPLLLDDFQQLLHDALDLVRELGDADDLSDPSIWDMPSISPHSQDRGFHEWTALIEILRDAWNATRQADFGKGRLIARNWFTLPYPTFKRLSLYAATFDGIIPQNEWVCWLLENDGWCLWSVQTKREVMRLLVLQGARLKDATLSSLEANILIGPPRSMYRDDLEPNVWARLVDSAIWLRLRKLVAGGGILGDDAAERLKELSVVYPTWELQTNESDEFSHWMVGTGDPDYVDRRIVDRAPARRRELMMWLRQAPSDQPFDEDDWRTVCLERFPVAACALYALSCDNYWPVARWRDALQAWSGENLVRRAWRCFAPTLKRMPDEQLLLVADSAAWWLESAAKVLDLRLDIFLDLCNRLLTIPLDDRSSRGQTGRRSNQSSHWSCHRCTSQTMV